MARIAGVDLPRDKRIEYGLTYIYGIGLTTSREILAKAGVDPDIPEAHGGHAGQEEAYERACGSCGLLPSGPEECKGKEQRGVHE